MLDPRVMNALLAQGWMPPNSQTIVNPPSLRVTNMERLQPTQPLPAMYNPTQGMAIAQPAPLSEGHQIAPQNPILDGNGPVSAQDIRNVGLALQSQALGVNIALKKAPINTLPVEDFLRKEFIEGKVIEKVAPQLLFLDFANIFTTDSKDVVWFRHRFTPDSDTGLKAPKPLVAGSEFPAVVAADPERKMGSTGTWGHRIEFTRDAIRHTNTAIDEIQRKVNWAAWKMAQKTNSVFANVMTQEFGSKLPVDVLDQILIQAAAKVWDDPAANPLKDMRLAALKMKTAAGTYFKPNVMLLGPVAYMEFLNYMTSVDHTWNMDPRSGERINTIDNIEIIEVPPSSGLPDTFAIMLARGGGVDPPLTVWESWDPEFSRTGMIHIHQYRIDSNHNRVTQMWKEFFVANRNPKAVVLMTGL